MSTPPSISPSQPILKPQPDSQPPTQSHPPTQKIYVLSADGSSLFLLDPTKPQSHEEPPPYATVHPTPYHHLTPNPSTSTFPRANNNAQSHEGRLRASTISTIGLGIDAGPSRRPVRPRYHSSVAGSGLRVGSEATGGNRSRSVNSTPNRRMVILPDENTPLLAREGDEAVGTERGVWRSIWCGEVEEGDEGNRWSDGWKRFWKPVGQGRYWKAMLHLWLINFPFALFIWPPLLVGTLVGTATLIVLPVGITVWWLTLYLTRTAARLETIMQVYYHEPSSHSTPIRHPIFHRIRERSTPSSPLSISSSLSEETTETVWETRFLKCSYAMFSDHYSYSALSYFLLIKPIITLFSTIALLALLPVAVALILGLPIYLRAAKRWGDWQAGVAMENL